MSGPPSTSRQTFFSIFQLRPIYFVLMLSVLACGAGAYNPGAESFISLEALENLCRLPAPCGTALPCEGRTVTLWGDVDPKNIFHKQNSPRTPYEKFKLVDNQGRSVEVWPKAGDSRPIFYKLAQRPLDRIRVTGRLVSFDMPVAGGCVRGVKVEIENVSQIQFK